MLLYNPFKHLRRREWVLATVSDLSYLPMVVNFSMFLINDLYGFISWKKREKKQGISLCRFLLCRAGNIPANKRFTLKPAHDKM